MEDVSACKEIEKEIQILRTCKHENIVGYYGTCTKKSQLWVSSLPKHTQFHFLKYFLFGVHFNTRNISFQILMEYCDNGSIKDLMTICKSPLNEDQIAYVCKSTLEGLKYLHAQRIVHRDIKAANILLMSGQVKIGGYLLNGLTLQSLTLLFVDD